MLLIFAESNLGANRCIVGVMRHVVKGSSLLVSYALRVRQAMPLVPLNGDVHALRGFVSGYMMHVCPRVVYTTTAVLAFTT